MDTVYRTVSRSWQGHKLAGHCLAVVVVVVVCIRSHNWSATQRLVSQATASLPGSKYVCLRHFTSGPFLGQWAAGFVSVHDRPLVPLPCST